MKRAKLMCLFGLIAFLPVLIGCATSFPIGFLYTELKVPVAADGAGQSACHAGPADGRLI